MLLGCVAFAGMGEMTHALRDDCDWRIIALARSATSLVLASAFALLAGQRLVLTRPRSLWMRSAAGSCSLVCTFFALTRLPVGDVLTLTNTFPVWIALLSWPLLGDRPAPSVWLAVLVAVTGVVLMQQPHVADGSAASLVALAAAFTTALAMIGLHRLEHLDPWPVVAHFGGVACVFCVLALLVGEPPRVSFGPATVLLLLSIGLSATVGQYFLTRAFAAGSPAKVSVISLSQVVLAMGLDVLLWDRSFTVVALAGIALVLTPSAWLFARRSPEKAA